MAAAKRVPPRPDALAALVGAVVGVAVFSLTANPVLSLIAFIIASLLTLPFALLARELALLGGAGVSVDEADKVYGWLLGLAQNLGVDRIALFYSTRTNMGLQVAGFGAGGQREQARAIPLLYRAAWVGAPIAVSEGGVVILAIPGLLMARLASIIGRGGKEVYYAKIASIGDAKLLYALIRAVVNAVVADRVFAAYTAYKTFSKMLLEGGINVEYSWLVDQLELRMPFEPPWIKIKVLQQLREEARGIVEP